MTIKYTKVYIKLYFNNLNKYIMSNLSKEAAKVLADMGQHQTELNNYQARLDGCTNLEELALCVMEHEGFEDAVLASLIERLEDRWAKTGEPITADTVLSVLQNDEQVQFKNDAPYQKTQWMRPPEL